MGKSIIVKGADFSTNAIDVAPLPTSLNITALLPALKPGYLTTQVNGVWSISQSTSRTTLESYFDVTNYKNTYGFTHIRVECLITGTSAIPVVVGDAQSVSSWTNTEWPLGIHNEISVNFNKGNIGTSDLTQAVKVTLFRVE